MTFSGDPGTSATWNQALLDNKVRVYIRRMQTVGSANAGPASPPLSLHGIDFATFTDGNDGVDSAGARIGKNKQFPANGSIVQGTFGLTSEAAVLGFYADIGIFDDTVEINTINVELAFTNGSFESNDVT